MVRSVSPHHKNCTWNVPLKPLKHHIWTYINPLQLISDNITVSVFTLISKDELFCRPAASLYSRQEPRFCNIQGLFEGNSLVILDFPPSSSQNLSADLCDDADVAMRRMICFICCDKRKRTAAQCVTVPTCTRWGTAVPKWLQTFVIYINSRYEQSCTSVCFYKGSASCNQIRQRHTVYKMLSVIWYLGNSLK